MSVDVQAWLKPWHAAVEAGDAAAVAGMLADDITMGAPPYWTDLQGKAVVERLIGVLVKTIEEFTYHREWIDGHELALEFRGRVGDLGLHGIDLITLNDAGLVQHLDVMIRPANALMELMTRVGQQLQA